MCSSAPFVDQMQYPGGGRGKQGAHLFSRKTIRWFLHESNELLGLTTQARSKRCGGGGSGGQGDGSWGEDGLRDARTTRDVSHKSWCGCSEKGRHPSPPRRAGQRGGQQTQSPTAKESKHTTGSSTLGGELGPRGVAWMLNGHAVQGKQSSVEVGSAAKGQHVPRRRRRRTDFSVARLLLRCLRQARRLQIAG